MANRTSQSTDADHPMSSLNTTLFHLILQHPWTFFQHQSSTSSSPIHKPYALILTETKIKPLDPSNSTVLSPHLKCPGYELFSSFFPNGGVCAFIRSDVQTLHLKQFDLSNPGFQLFWLKKFSFLKPQSTFALYTALLTQTIMNFSSTTFLNQLKPLLYNLHALKSLFLVISTSTTPTGSPIPPMSPTLLVGKLRPLPLSMT